MNKPPFACGTCNKVQRQNEKEGYCRARPATALMVGMKQTVMGPSPVVMGAFPTVSLNLDYCHEHPAAHPGKLMPIPTWDPRKVAYGGPAGTIADGPYSAEYREAAEKATKRLPAEDVAELQQQALDEQRERAMAEKARIDDELPLPGEIVGGGETKQ